MQPQTQFEVVIHGYPSNQDDRRRADALTLDQLPVLSEAQKEYVRKVQIPEEVYARSIRASEFGNERWTQRGQRLGELIVSILKEIASPAELTEVEWQSSRTRWLARFITPNGPRGIALSWEWVDDWLDSQILREREKIAAAIKEGLGKIPDGNLQ